MSVRFITADRAAALIPDGANILVDGFFGYGVAEDILAAMEDRYKSETHPAKLNLRIITDPTIDGETRGINHFDHDGMIAEIIGANMTHAKKISDRAMKGEFPIWLLPQGVVTEMCRAIASGRPGVLTTVGLYTYADPRIEGCCMNEAASGSSKRVVEHVQFNGEETLFYLKFPLDIVLLKATSADEDGNISWEKEGCHIQQLELAMAARNSGGKVFVQVDRLLKRNSIRPCDVVIPKNMVDYVVLGRPENSRQQYVWPDRFRDELCGVVRIVLDQIPPIPLNIRKIIARRAAQELRSGDFINLGIGIPTHVADVLAEEGQSDKITMSFESGVVGGVPTSGFAAGSAYNPDAILRHADMFNFYDGGGIDMTCLGGAEIDKEGNVNVSRFNGRITGPGGFINISQNAKTVCFIGTFTAGACDIRIEPDGRLNIVKDGSVIKFVDKVGQITFSGNYARKLGKNVKYITERAVFEMRPEGLTLIEIADGVDLKTQILDKMGFAPIIANDLKQMDKKIFMDSPMGLKLKEK